MAHDRFQWLAGVIAAHPDRKVVGRTRLQKTIKLLQRLSLPTDYGYQLHFYGPYSEGLQAEIGLLEHMKLVTEAPGVAGDGTPYYILRASKKAVLPEMERFQAYVDEMTKTDAVVLELAATYDAFREMGEDHETALVRLRRKKGSKCEHGREQQALDLLRDLGLSAA